MVFRNTATPSTLQYVSIENASAGPVPIIENAAISAMNADLVLDHLTITKTFGNPIMARYSDVVLTNSELHSEVTGDLINVKYGTAHIENCKFTGNDMPDTDAIDYDEVAGGVIRNVSINGFYGFNSDAVDIGEEAEDVTIDSIVVYNITDKGISLGQLSTATVSNSIFINCNLGVAVKDSSTAIINNSVFYNNVYPVACYEKNVGLAGGNASVRNSILSNYAESIYLQDQRSTIRFSHTLADGNDSIPGNENLLGDPLFREPSYFDFELNSSSPAILSGIDSNGNPVNIGTQLSIADFEPTIMITEFFVNAPDGLLPEYIKVYNPTDKTVNASGYYIDKGITATIPEGTIINPGRHLYLTSDASDYLWDGVIVPVIQWEDGHLSNNGEAIRLLDDHGIVLDHFRYDINGDWPAEGFGIDRAFVLRDLSLDNHFGKNWSSEILSNLVGDLPVKMKGEGMKVYPNPGNGIITIECSDQTVNQVRVFDIRGALLTTIQLDYSGTAHPDLSSLGSGMYILKAGDNVEKIIIR